MCISTLAALKKSSKKKKTGKKKDIVKMFQQASDRRKKEGWRVKIWDYEFLGFDLGFFLLQILTQKVKKVEES